MQKLNDLKQHPGVLTFLPVLYTIWSDFIINEKEAKILSETIQNQTWLGDSEKSILKNLTNPENNLEPDELKGWLNTINGIPLTHCTNLISLGVELARSIHPSFDIPQSEKIKLLELDRQLGIPEGEFKFIFNPELRKPLSSSHQTHASFDISRMTELLEGADAKTIKKTIAVITDPSFKYIDTGDLNTHREAVLNWAKKLAANGFGSMAYPKEYGGGNDLAAYFTIMETLSYHDLSLVVKFGVQFGLWGMSVYLLGTEKHHKKYLKDIGTLDLPGCFAMTETGHGSNVRGIETTATYDHTNRTFRINTPNDGAQKEYIGNAALHGRMATVFAKIMIQGKDYGVGAFIVPLRDNSGKLMPGITIKDCGRKLGLNGVDNGVIRFSQVVIPADEMLDRFATVNAEGNFESPIASDNRRFFTMLGALVGGRIGIPRSGLAATRSALTIAIRYGDERKQFGPESGSEVPILNYRTHQQRLIPKLATSYALHFSLQYLTSRYINRKEDEMQEIEGLAAGLKAITTWHTTDTLQTCRECCGGKGYLWENRIGTLKNDADIYTTFEGDNTVLLQLLAKSRLSEFKQEFSNMKLTGLLDYIAGQAAVSITEMNPLIIRNTSEEHLLSSEFHLEAFTFRERDLLTSAAKRLRRLITDGMDSFDAFNVCQQHLVDVGKAYVEKIILREFLNAIEQVKDQGCKSILTRLCQVYALSKLDEHKGWYLEQGYMEGAKTKAIRKLLSQQCWEVRKEAVPLVDAFNIPDQLLSAPIAVRSDK
jgi:acyl-CoA oxidase